MDMRKKLGVWLSGGAIHAMGDRYEGTIAHVVEHEVRNKWTTKTTVESVIVFDDGKQLVLTRPMKFELIDRFGHESDDWIGERIVLGCRRVDRTDPKTGNSEVRFEKYLLPRNREPDVKELAPSWATEHDSEITDPVDLDDADDVDTRKRPFRRRG